MNDMYLCAPLGDGREICISPLSRQTFEANDLDALGDNAGYFIYEFDSRSPSSGIEVLAKAASYNAALRLVDIFVSAQKQALERLLLTVPMPSES